MKRVEAISVYTDYYRAFLRSKRLEEGDLLPPTWEFFEFIGRAQRYALEQGMGVVKAAVWPGHKVSDQGQYALAINQYAEKIRCEAQESS